MTKNLVLLFFMMSFILFWTGCGTILGRSNQTVTINTVPSGANCRVYHENKNIIYEGMTPSKLVLNKDGEGRAPASYLIVCNLQNYRTEIVDLKASGNTWIGIMHAIGIFAGIVPGAIAANIDMYTGACYDYADPQIQLQQIN